MQLPDGGKQPYLVCYDYGMGGLWAVVRARAASDIRTVYPELMVFEEPPAWMDKQTYDGHLRDREDHDIDGAARGVLGVVVADRHHP